MDTRITRDICISVNVGQRRRFSPFQLIMDPAERIDELKLEVTAPMIAARPSKPITGGVT